MLAMLTSQSREILDKFQVRKSSQEKKEFRAWLRGELEAAGWTTAEEGAFFNGHNVIAGDPDTAKVFFTAHYDTQAVLPFPNFITPHNLFIYILFNIVICLGMFIFAALVTAAAVWVPTLMGAPTEVCAMVGSLAWLASFAFILWWLFFGKANRHTVNDNTSGVLTLLETALALPAEDRSQVCIIFFDNEERGMLGSSHFASQHKRAKQEGLVLNFDCVSDGDHIQFFPTKTLKGETTLLELLENTYRTAEGERRLASAAGESAGEKEVEVVRGFGFYPSDNASFKRACGVCALKKSRVFGYYMDRIHTARDTVLMEENIELLRSGNLALVGVLPEGNRE